MAKEILPSGRHRIAAVYTRNIQKCRDFAGKYGGAAYDSAEAAICAPEVDGVYIVTPHTSHDQYAKLALSLGKPVLCEKPITVTAPEASGLFVLAAAVLTWLVTRQIIRSVTILVVFCPCAAAAELRSEHPLGKAVVRCCRAESGGDVPDPEQFQMLTGDHENAA